MQLSITVEGSQLDNEMKDLLSSLTLEQKSKMAEQVAMETLKFSESRLSVKRARQQALEDMKKATESTNLEVDSNGKLVNSSGRYVSWDDQDKFQKLVKKYASLHDYFETVVLEEFMALTRDKVRELVRESPLINQAINAAAEEIKAELPKMVRDAMVVYFASQMEAMMTGLARTVVSQQNDRQLLNTIRETLASKGLS